MGRFCMWAILGWVVFVWDDLVSGPTSPESGKKHSPGLQTMRLILLNIMSLDIDIIYTNDIFRLQSSDTTFGALLYLALF